MKTNKEHIAAGGGQCPKCSGDNIVFSELRTVDSGSCSQPMSCLDCNFSWKDIYQLIGYEPEE